MLQKVETFEELDFAALMKVYAEGVVENGKYFYPNEPKERQIQLAERDFRNYLNEDFFKTMSAFYCVWAENGSYVSALRLEPYKDGLLIEGLGTRPEERRKGYAKLLLRAVTDSVSEKLYSIVSKANTASLRTHQSCGFKKILDYAIDSGDGAMLDDHVTLCFIK